MANYTRFSAWKRFLAGREYQTDNPFERQPLGPAPVFLYSESTSPLPSASTAGVWMAYPSPQKLAAHLRFGLLPLQFSIWLCRDEWDSTPEQPKIAEMIFEGAQTANNRYVQDIPIMKKVIAELDVALKTAADTDAWRRVQKACRIFNSRWESAPTWNFVHKPLRGFKALVKDMTVRASVDEEYTEQIKALATTELSDPKAQRKLKALLKEAVVC
jgi:hypothetical protein